MYIYNRICIYMIIQVQRGLFWRESTLHCSISLLYCTPEITTNKTLALSQNDPHGTRFISPLIQCTANTDEAAA